MAEYIDRDKAFEAVDKRVDELKGDKQFTLPKEICVRGVMKHLVDIPVADVIEIPKNVTNGDIIIALYPNLRYSILAGRVITTIDIIASFDLDWWNSPYKADKLCK